MINRLIEPTGGRIVLDGTNVLDQDPVQLRRGIGYVIQHTGLLPHRTIRQNIATVPNLVGWDDARTARASTSCSRSSTSTVSCSIGIRRSSAAGSASASVSPARSPPTRR